VLGWLGAGFARAGLPESSEFILRTGSPGGREFTCTLSPRRPSPPVVIRSSTVAGLRQQIEQWEADHQ
jgi:hypothetical protein